MATNKINSIKTLAELEAYRTEINEACDKRAKFITRCAEADELSKKPFNYIKESFEAISPVLFKSAEGKGIINKYTATIRESKNLSAIHALCENIRKANKNSDVDFFVNNIANENWGISRKGLNEDCKKLGRVLAEGYLLIEDDITLPKENASLSSAINFIAEHKKTSKNIAEYSDAVKVIRENVNKNETVSNVFESVDLDKLAKGLIAEFNKKYSDVLTEEEANALKEISSSADRESVFNKYKTACTVKISEAKKNFEANGDSSSCDRLTTVLEQVSNKTYSLDTVGSDVCSLIELSNIFE